MTRESRFPAPPIYTPETRKEFILTHSDAQLLPCKRCAELGRESERLAFPDLEFSEYSRDGNTSRGYQHYCRFCQREMHAERAQKRNDPNSLAHARKERGVIVRKLGVEAALNGNGNGNGHAHEDLPAKDLPVPSKPEAPFDHRPFTYADASPAITAHASIRLLRVVDSDGIVRRLNAAWIVDVYELRDNGTLIVDVVLGVPEWDSKVHYPRPHVARFGGDNAERVLAYLDALMGGGDLDPLLDRLADLERQLAAQMIDAAAWEKKYSELQKSIRDVAIGR